MTTFTDDDKGLIKEIRERIGSLDVRDNIERRAYEIALASLEAGVVAWRYRYVKKDVTDSQGKTWVGDWKYVPTKEDCNDRPNYEIQEPRQPGGCKLKTAPVRPVVAARPAEYV
ncbi:hypothetical protein JYG42_18085, partial [Escherichia fergusonii]|nr:hypothetical protein [Escherichia fergusonii]